MKKSVRYSRQREEILRFLRSTDSHPNAETIYNFTRKVIPNISMGTVYRNLQFLVNEGIIHRIQIGENCDCYDWRTEKHSHTVCSVCGKIEDVFLQDIMPFPVQNFAHFVEESIGFKVESSFHIIKGICKNCQNKSVSV